MPKQMPPELTTGSEGRLLFERSAALSDAMMFITDLETNSVWVNERLVELTGYTLEDYQFQRFENPFIPEEDVARVGEFIGAFLASDEVVSRGTVQNRFVDRWGGTLHVVTRVAKVTWEGVDALLYSTTLTDSDSRRSEEIEQRYRSLVESATDAIVRLREDLTFHYSNQCFQGLVGHGPVSLNTRTFLSLVTEPYRSRVAQELASLGSGENKVSVTAPVESADGGTVWLEGTFVRIRSGVDAGRLQAILRDTTQQRRLDAALAQAHKSETLARMAGGIAHDLNNILTGVVGSASLAEFLVRPGTEVARALSNIRLAATRAGELSSSMLAYAGEGTSERVPIDFTELVAEMQPLLGSAVGRGVTLDVDTPFSTVRVEADEIQLRQLVMNLITNAADATRGDGGGTVYVKVGTRVLESHFANGEFVFGSAPPPGQQVAFVVVSDEGAGMAPETVGRMFDPFFTTKTKGRGLGLSAVLGILGRHDGCVRVDSRLGRGTRMEVVLPLCSASVEAPKASTGEPRSLHDRTILVVDDEATIRDLVRKTFEQRGMRVLEAKSGEEALELLQAAGDKVGVVLLDQTMPGMGGDRTLMAIRDTRPRLPVVRTSGNLADPRLTERDKHTQFLGKPYGIRQLIETVYAAIEGRTAPDRAASKPPNRGKP